MSFDLKRILKKYPKPSFDRWPRWKRNLMGGLPADYDDRTVNPYDLLMEYKQYAARTDGRQKVYLVGCAQTAAGRRQAVYFRRLRVCTLHTMPWAAFHRKYVLKEEEKKA